MMPSRQIRTTSLSPAHQELIASLFVMTMLGCALWVAARGGDAWLVLLWVLGAAFVLGAGTIARRSQQITIRIPREWLYRTDAVATKMSRPGLEMSRADVLQMALTQGLEAVEAGESSRVERTVLDR